MAADGAVAMGFASERPSGYDDADAARWQRFQRSFQGTGELGCPALAPMGVAQIDFDARATAAERKRGGGWRQFQRIGQQQHDYLVVLREHRPAARGQAGDAVRVGQHDQPRTGT